MFVVLVIAEVIFLNVIIVNDYSYINGGASAIAIETAIALAERGHKVIFFSAVAEDNDILKGNSKVEIVCTKQYDILNNPNRLEAIVQGLWNIKAAKLFKKVLENYSPKNTVIHVHGLQKAISASIVPIAKTKGFKVVYHMHDYGMVCPNLGLFNYVKKAICRYKPMSFSCIRCNCDSRCYKHKVWRVIRQYVQKMCGMPELFDGIVYVSKFSQNLLSKYVGTGKVIYNPILIEKRHRVKAEENKYALYIGRLSPEKNPMVLAKVAKKLNIPVIFIGDGICRNEIKNLNPNAICTGWLDKSEMQKYIDKARFCVFPSLLYETQGLVVAEAMAYGIPVISSDNTAAMDFINVGVNGLSFTPNNVASLETAIQRMSDDEYVAYLGENAYKGTFQSINNYIKEIEQYYFEVLEKV